MEMYRTANPGMTVRPRPWPRGVASGTELESIKKMRNGGRKTERKRSLKALHLK